MFFHYFDIQTKRTLDLERYVGFAAKRQDFELAAKYRDEIKGLREWFETLGE